MQPYILHIEEWDKIVQSGFQSEELAALSQFNEDILSISFRAQKQSGQSPLTLSLTSDLMDNGMVSKSSFPLLPSPPANLNERFANGLQFIAKLNKPIFISAATGRRLHDILFSSNSATTFPVTQMQAYPQQGQLPPIGLQVPNVKSLEEVLLPDKTPGLLYELDMRDLNGAVPLRAKIQPVSMGVPAFKLEQFAFENVDQLMAAVETLRLQACYNDMLSILFAGSSPSATRSSVDAEANVTLESLLSGKINSFDGYIENSTY